MLPRNGVFGSSVNSEVFETKFLYVFVAFCGLFRPWNQHNPFLENLGRCFFHVDFFRAQRENVFHVSFAPQKKTKNAKKHQQQAFSTKIAQATALNGLGLCKRNLPQIYQDFIRGGEAEKSIRNQAVCQRFSVNFGDEFFKIFGWYTVRFTTDFCFRSFRQKKTHSGPQPFVASTSWREGWKDDSNSTARRYSTPQVQRYSLILRAGRNLWWHRSSKSWGHLGFLS